jgi:hypothetical protein
MADRTEIGVACFDSNSAACNLAVAAYLPWLYISLTGTTCVLHFLLHTLFTQHYRCIIHA